MVKGDGALTADTALRLAAFFGNSPEFWLNLQRAHDLAAARKIVDVSHIRPLAAADEAGAPIPAAKDRGLRAIRYVHASWCIDRKEGGGLGLPPKMVQERLGHSTIAPTMDTCGHLFPTGDDASELASAEAALLG